MKTFKYLSLGIVLSSLCWVAPLWAQDLTEEDAQLIEDIMEEIASELQECDTIFTHQERQSAQKLNDFFKYYRSSIVKKYPGTDSIILNFQQKLENTLECNSSNKFNSYIEYRKAFMTLLQNIISQEVVSEFTVDPEAEEAVLMLQKHVVDLLASDYDRDKPIKQTSSMVLEVDIDFPDKKMWAVEWKVEVASEWVYDIEKGEFDVNLQMNWEMHVESQTLDHFDYSEDERGTPVYKDIEMDLGFDLDLDMIQKDDLYMRINDGWLDIESPSLTEEEQFEMNFMEAMVEGTLDGIRGQYINLTTGSYYDYRDMNGGNMLVWSNDVAKLVKDIEEKPLMEFRKDGNIWYGRFSENVCNLEINEVVTDPYNDYDDYYYNDHANCEDTLAMMNAETDGHGYLVMKKQNNNYTVGFTDEYMDENLEGYEEIITWNENQVNKMFVPLGDDLSGYLKYENGKVVGYYEDEEGKFTLDSIITYNNKKFILDLELKEEDMQIHGEILFTKQWNTTELVVDAVVTFEGEEVAIISMRNKEAIEYLRELNITAPEWAIPLEEIEWVMGMGF